MRKNIVFIAALILVLVIVGPFVRASLPQVKDDGAYPILMYHHLVPASECAEGTSSYGNNAVISVENFEQQMEYLHKSGATTLLMSELYSYLSQGLTPPEGSVIITFDDGYASNYTYAFPILKKYQLKANIAIMVKATEDGDGGNSQLPHLSFEQIKEMANSGLIEFGSHTYDGHGQVPVDKHGKMEPAMVSKIYDLAGSETDYEYEERIREELTRSKEVLEKNTGQEVIYFSYPYGRYNETLLNMVWDTGYKLALTTRSAYATTEDNNLLLPRINVDQNMSLNKFRQIVTTK